MSSTFSLQKWYFDLVDADGATWIGYSGEIRYRRMRVPFSSAFRGGEDAHNALRFSAPRVTPLLVSWDAQALGVKYELAGNAVPVERCLFDSPRGSVQWQCFRPSGSATLRHRDGEMSGFGYAELLTMTIPPWRLPLTELRWGRFVTARSALAWIQWEGAAPLMLAVRDGHATGVRAIGDDALLIEGGVELRMTDRMLVRDGMLGETLRPLGPLRGLLPARLTQSQETKWRSRGVMMAAGKVVDEGWVIHERVTFPAG